VQISSTFPQKNETASLVKKNAVDACEKNYPKDDILGTFWEKLISCKE
jgi:hypothetical protein